MGFLVLLGISICCVATIQAQFRYTGTMQFGVEMNVFSGRTNPKWMLNDEHPLYERIAYGLSRTRSTPLPGRLGYGGFSIEMRNSLGQRAYKSIAAGKSPRLEVLLLNSAPYSLGRSVRRTVITAIRGLKEIPVSQIYRPRGEFKSPRRSRGFCRLPRFNPEFWNVSPYLRRNNCYNYATNRPTNTFAQPGRATGLRFSRPITAYGVLRSTISDGLVWLPFFSPRAFPQYCYIALAIWPGVDYHFYRLDSNMLWSHKPGKTPAKNTDNSGNLIVDPLTADRGNYVIFAGYLGNHPGVRLE